MQNENQPNGAAPVKPQVKQVKEVKSDDVLERIEGQLANVIKLQWKMIRTLQSIVDSIGIFAAQKKRELDPEEASSETGQ